VRTHGKGLGLPHMKRPAAPVPPPENTPSSPVRRLDWKVGLGPGVVRLMNVFVVLQAAVGLRNLVFELNNSSGACIGVRESRRAEKV